MDRREHLREVSGTFAGRRQAIADLAPGDRVDEIFYLREVTMRKARDGREFLALRLSDKSGTADGRAWGEAGVRLREILGGGCYARIKGSVVDYRGRPQVRVEQALPLKKDEVDAADFLPVSFRDRDELTGYVLYFIAEVYDDDYRSLLESFFHDPEFLAGFQEAPGDTRSHHAYLGGLLEHTVSVATLCQHVAVQHPRLKSDLLLTAALLHDIGKTEEFTLEGEICYSREGRMLGHVVLGQRMIEARLRATSFPRDKELELMHALISHHGELEWGAPKRPQSAEALVLHHIDNLDAKVKGFLEVIDGRGEVPWAEMQNLFRRPLDMPMAANRHS